MSSVLQETHHNLHTFEFMLSQYKARARVQPMVKAGEEPEVNRLLEELSEAVGKVSELKERMRDVPKEPDYELKFREAQEQKDAPVTEHQVSPQEEPEPVEVEIPQPNEPAVLCLPQRGS